MNRRDFITTAAVAPAVSALAAEPARTRPELCIFSKHMGQLKWEELGAKAKEMGFDGVDLTVRPGGHVLPERVAEDLPKYVEIIRKNGLTVPMITTDLKDVSDPAAKPTFETMKKLGIPLYKPGYWLYRPREPKVLERVAECKRKFEAMVALSSEYGLTAGLHNHSGAYVGCSVWDVREILSGTSAKDGGFYFDPGHSVIEGGAFGWRVSLDLALQRLKMSAIKDFYWEKKNGRWQEAWCPLGEGMVPWPAVFQEYAKAGFTGPLSLHLEYPGGDDFPSIAKDLAFMRKQVETAYSR